jgi:hypothetical protein
MIDFQTVRDLAKQMIEADGPRNALFAQYKAAYEMDWSLESPAEYVKPTISPDAHNAVRGTVNILTTTAPVITVPHAANDRRAEALADRVQKTLTLILRRASRASDEAVEVSAVRTATRDAFIAFKVTRTADLAEADGLTKEDRKAGKKSKALSDEQRKRYKELAEQVPFLVKTLEPAAVHIQRSICGLERVVDVQKYTIAQVKQEWTVPEGMFTETDDYKEVEVVSYWDREVTCVWVDSYNVPLLDVTAHRMPFLPYVIRSAGESMLYGVVKSKAWEYQNLILTMMATGVFTLGNPVWVVESSKSEDLLTMDFSAPGNKLPLLPGEKIYPLMKDLIGKDMSQLYSVVSTMVEDTTVSKYVFGAAPQSTLAFASLNLMVQGGRIPLAPIQAATALALSELCELVCKWIKHAKKGIKLYVDGELLELGPSDIDLDKLSINVQLQPDLPQDRLQVANTVNMLRSGDKPLISAETGRDMLPGVNAKDEEQKLIREQIMALMAQLELAHIQQERQAALQPPPQQQPAPPQQLQLPPGMPAEMQGAPPEMGAPAPDMGGLPPTLATGQPPEEQLQAAMRGGGPPPGSE